MNEEIAGYVFFIEESIFNTSCHKCVFNDYSGCKLKIKEFKGVSKRNKKTMHRICDISLNGYWKCKDDND